MFGYSHASEVAQCKLVGGMVFMISEPSCSLFHVQDGLTALFIASRNGHDQIVELLLKKEVDLNHQTKVRPLMLVCVFLHEECLFQHRFVIHAQQGHK